MKLDVNVLRYLSKDDFRVLTSIEMGQKNVGRSCAARARLRRRAAVIWARRRLGLLSCGLPASRTPLPPLPHAAARDCAPAAD